MNFVMNSVVALPWLIFCQLPKTICEGSPNTVV